MADRRLRDIGTIVPSAWLAPTAWLAPNPPAGLFQYRIPDRAGSLKRRDRIPAGSSVLLSQNDAGEARAARDTLVFTKI